MIPTQQRSRIQVNIHAIAPLVLGEKSGMSNFEQTLDYIPGVRLRGAVAKRAYQECTQSDHINNHATCPDREKCPFWQLFGEDDIFFSSAYAGLSAPVYPIPLTTHTCKYYPGIPEADNEHARDDAHGIWDTLLERSVHEALLDPIFPLRDKLLPSVTSTIPRLPPWAYKETCPKCGKPAQIAEGFYTPGVPPSAAGNVPSARQMHVGINRTRFAAEDALLFTQESLDTRGTRINFFSQVSVPQQKLDLLNRYLRGTHTVGRGRSRGYGTVEIATAVYKEESPLEERLSAMQMATRAVLSAWRLEDSHIPESFPFQLLSITLTSPTIFESFGCAHLVPTPLEINIPDAVLLRAWTRPTTISGWEVAAGLPRRTRQAASAGSVYLFAAPLNQNLIQALTVIEVDGLGEDRTRGFGQALVCAPIHTDTLRTFGRSS